MKNEYWYGLYLGIFVFLSLHGNANAVTKEVADKAVIEFEKLSHPTRSSTPFDIWTYDTAAFTVGHCWSSANPSTSVLPKSLNGMNFGAGTWVLPDKSKDEALCKSIVSDGINPVCTHSKVWVKDFKRSNKWPMDYLEAPKDYSNIVVEGQLGCYLNSKQVQTQFYTATLTTEWVVKPHRESLQTVKGAEMVNMGNVRIKDAYAKGIDGKLYSEPKMVIIQE